LSLGTLNISF